MAGDKRYVNLLKKKDEQLFFSGLPRNVSTMMRNHYERDELLLKASNVKIKTSTM